MHNHMWSARLWVSAPVWHDIGSFAIWDSQMASHLVPIYETDLGARLCKSSRDGRYADIYKLRPYKFANKWLAKACL